MMKSLFAVLWGLSLVSPGALAAEPTSAVAGEFEAQSVDGTAAALQELNRLEGQLEGMRLSIGRIRATLLAGQVLEGFFPASSEVDRVWPQQYCSEGQLAREKKMKEAYERASEKATVECRLRFPNCAALPSRTTFSFVEGNIKTLGTCTVHVVVRGSQ